MAGLDTLPDATTIARLVRSATGNEPRGARPLGSGVTTIAWRIDTDREPLVVLIARPVPERPGEQPRFGGQLAVLDALHGLDARVPRPIAWSGDPDSTGLARFDLEWAIESEAAGKAAGEAGSAEAGSAEAVTEDVARDLGELLARLHALPASGFGRVTNARGGIVGGATSMTEGLLERWPQLWPFDGTSLISHPVARAAPRLIEPLSQLREPLLRFGLLTRGAPLHADLNAAHVFVREGRLATLIDFSDAFVGPFAVDIASFAFFFGWRLVGPLLEGYAESRVLRETRLAEAQLFGVAHALQKVHKHSRLQQPERLQRSLAVLEETVGLASHLLRG